MAASRRATSTFPRLTSRGPIEARSSSKRWQDSSNFPRLTSRGPIEARSQLCKRQHSCWPFPRLTSRGPIEANAKRRRRKCQLSIRPSPQRAKHRCVDSLADGFRPFRAGMRFDAPNPGRCPGLSPCAPLGHKTIGSRTTNHRGPNSPKGA